MLKVNHTQREEMRVFLSSNSYLTWENGERHGVCLFRILHAQPESALEHKIMSSFGVMFKVLTWGPYLHLSSPGDLLQTSLLRWARGGQGGPPAPAHPQACRPGGEVTCTAYSVVLLGSTQSCFNTHSLVDSTHTCCLWIR